MKDFFSSATLTTIAFWIVAGAFGYALWGAHVSWKDTILIKDPVCNEEEHIFACYERFYNELVRKGSVTMAVEDIRNRYTTDSTVNILCHELMHVIGRAAVGASDDISTAFSKGSGFCLSGYYHGVVETFVEKGGEKMLTEGAGVAELCEVLRSEKRYSFDHFNCEHGIGHGAVITSRYDLPGSLKMCDFLPGTWERESCYGGVFMQNMMVDGDDHKTEYLKDDDPLYPCNAIDEKYKEMCWSMQTSQILVINGRDYAKAFAICDSLRAPYDTMCYLSLGRDASGDASGNPKKVKDTCGMGNTDEQLKNCVVGAARDFVQVYHSDTRAKELCDLFTGDIKSSCTEAVDAYYATF